MIAQQVLRYWLHLARNYCIDSFNDHIGAEHHQTIVNGAHIVGAADVNLALLNDVAGVDFVL